MSARKIVWNGNLLRRWRRQKGWRAIELAHALHVSEPSVFKWESGIRTPPLSVAHRIVALTEGRVRYRDIYKDFRPEFA